MKNYYNMSLKKNYLLLSTKFINDVYPNRVCSFFIKSQKKNNTLTIITVIINTIFLSYAINLFIGVFYILLKLAFFVMILMIIKSFL